ncbi:MAG: alpha/beta hydrolase [Balneolaceae bacterium]|nr:alpha/beta hydrolase [Balneolaceae bacterium]
MAVTFKIFFLCLIIPQFLTMPLKSQEIIYGSNDGKYVEVSGRDVYYEEYGEGETVLMLHGGPGSIANFSKLIPEISKNYRVIAIDTPGQGHSERAHDVSYQLLAENASGFIDTMGIQNCYVVGWSDGAVTGLLLAAKRPDVISKVFASGGFSNIDGFTEEAKKFWSTLTPETVIESWDGWHLEYQKLYPENDWKTLISDLRNMVNDEIYITEKELESITSKVLLAYGDNDLITFEHITYLYRTIPDSKLMIFPGTSHSTFDEQPEMMSLAVQNFFEN